MMKPDRRRFLRNTGSVLLGAGAASNTAIAAVGMITPAATSGPFYPLEYPLDADADLVTVAGQDRPASGEITHLAGSVYDRSGNPLQGLVVEIWQCDAFGFYHHPGDRGDRAEPQFQGFGKSTTGSGGEYHFRTIKPARYTGRTPHIHFLVRDEESVLLVSQLYDRNEPGNENDFLFRRIPADMRPSVTTEFLPAANTDSGISDPGVLVASFDIVLGITSPIA